MAGPGGEPVSISGIHGIRMVSGPHKLPPTLLLLWAEMLPLVTTPLRFSSLHRALLHRCMTYDGSGTPLRSSCTVCRLTCQDLLAI